MIEFIATSNLEGLDIQSRSGITKKFDKVLSAILKQEKIVKLNIEGHRIYEEKIKVLAKMIERSVEINFSTFPITKSENLFSLLHAFSKSKVKGIKWPSEAIQIILMNQDSETKNKTYAKLQDYEKRLAGRISK